MNKFLYIILRFSGLSALFRFIKQTNKVSILMFHDIDKSTAEQSFKYLKKRYNIISLNTFIEAYYNKDLKSLPKRALILTFDDGHIRNYEMLSVLKQYNIPITIFLCSEIINTNRHYWFKFKTNAVVDFQELKKMETYERLKELSKIGFEQEKEYTETQALQKEHIEDMKPYVDFQAHTMFHPILPMCTDSESKEEITICKKQLEENFNLTINSFAYPNGDFNDRDVQHVKEAGYKCAVSVEPGYNTNETDIFKLKRLNVSDTKDINELAVKSSGLWGSIKKII